jgi:uncharacterized SAM-binding protein YcdF (DUF218 family)
MSIMIRRLVSLALLAWLLGFLWFAIALPQPAGAVVTDGVVVVTGGTGRVARGLAVLRDKLAERLLVSGVGQKVKPHEFALEYKVDAATMACCVQLGFAAVDTRSNADETARWVAENKIRTLRLVTNDWHMRRARFELERVLPASVTVTPDAVPSQPSMRTLFLEYHKLLARRGAELGGG